MMCNHVIGYLCFVNSSAPGKFELNFRYVIFKRILVIDGWGISCEIALIWMTLGLHWWSVNIGSGNGWAITWASVDPDLCHHMVSLGHNELNSLQFRVLNVKTNLILL